jgi:hypothetical protein
MLFLASACSEFYFWQAKRHRIAAQQNRHWSDIAVRGKLSVLS